MFFENINFYFAKNFTAVCNDLTQICIQAISCQSQSNTKDIYDNCRNAQKLSSHAPM